MGFFDFLKFLVNDIPQDYQGKETGYHVVPDDVRFTYSSVAGDYRLYPIAGGFVAAWRTFLSARDAEGRELWRADNTGRAVAVSPDGRQLLSYSDQTQFLTLYDAQTGGAEQSYLLPEFNFYPSQILWLPDGRWLFLNSTTIGVLAGERLQWQECYTDFGATGGSFLQGMAWLPERPDELLITDGNGNRVFRFSLSTGKVLQQAEFQSPNMYPGPTGRQALLELHQEYVLLDPATLAVQSRYPFAGLEGVQTETQHQDNSYSSTRWEKRALLSPNGKMLLAIDNSGLLWLFDVPNGYKLRVFRRELIDHAFDVLWLDDQFFVALCNRGHVVKADIKKPEGVFDVVDFTDDDDEHHLNRGAW